MPLELFVKKIPKFDSPYLTVRNGRIALNAAAANILVKADAEFAHILWDPDAHRIAIKYIPRPDENSFKISFYKGKCGGIFSGQSFLKHIQWHSDGPVTVPLAWNHLALQLEATLPKENIGSTDARKRMKKSSE